MAIVAEKEIAYLGKTHGAADHDHDMIQDLSKRLDALWRYDQYIANAEGKPELQKFWQDMKTHDQESVMRLKGIISEHCRKGCF